MASSNNAAWVVTGGNRGIGLGFVKALIARPSVTVIATRRRRNLVYCPIGLHHRAPPDQIRKLFDIDHILSCARDPDRRPPLRLRDQYNRPADGRSWALALVAKSSAPKVVNVSSSVGCITYHEVVAGAYGPSKAALNWITRALHLQNESLVAFALHPGFVNTEMGESAATEWGFPHAMLGGVEEAVKGSLGIIDSATRENVSGKFVSYKGQELPW
ncbi:hypothetical protein FANTH_13385 [Fusarium anthophilum]|uniref:Uncharacterized protein n=1 Tax=Fusarium anthophilum TaxID=48485 RepID=A0A8H4YNZ2_9HYPO|nr:hypothetical protein FANTH_13385 [Fusarium anthophilum]